MDKDKASKAGELSNIIDSCDYAIEYLKKGKALNWNLINKIDRYSIKLNSIQVEKIIIMFSDEREQALKELESL